MFILNANREYDTLDVWKPPREQGSGERVVFSTLPLEHSQHPKFKDVSVYFVKLQAVLRYLAEKPTNVVERCTTCLKLGDLGLPLVIRI